MTVQHDRERAVVTEPGRVIVLDEETSEREVMDLVGAVSHEMRTPLTAISGYAATMRLHWDGIDTGTKLEFLAVIERQAQRLTRLTGDLLSLSKLDAGSLETEPEDVPVARAIAETLAALPDLDVRVRGDTTVVVRVDRIHLEDMLTNLITNADKYGEPPITIEVQRDGNDGVIRVCDEGPGVPQGYEKRMWERFSRARASERPSGVPGSGLGLAVVAGMATANGGQVWYEPNEPTGSRFCLRFPLVRRPE